MRAAELRKDVDQQLIKIFKECYIFEREELQEKQQLNEWGPIAAGLLALGVGFGILDAKIYKEKYDAAGGGKAGWNAIKNDLAIDTAIMATTFGAGKLGHNLWKLRKQANQAGSATTASTTKTAPTTKDWVAGGGTTATGGAVGSQADWSEF